jgi:hypothetical protein
MAGLIFSPFAAFEQGRSHALPVAGRIFPRRHDERRVELGHVVELLEVVGEGVEDGLVVFLPGLLRVDGGDAGGNQGLVIGEFLLPVRHVLRLKGVLELLVKHQLVEDLATACS